MASGTGSAAAVMHGLGPVGGTDVVLGRPRLGRVAPDALAVRDGKTVVFAVSDGKAAEVTVTPGRKIGELTAITGEVKTGEKAVLKPTSDLSPGMQVKAAGK